MSDLTDLQMRTLEVLSTHPLEYPITGKEIATFIGLRSRSSGKDGADVRSIIHALRVKGYPICAYGNGYFYASNGDELQGYIASLEARAREVQEAADGLKAGFAIVGSAKAQEAVKASVQLRFRVIRDGQPVVIVIPERARETFLSNHPEAEEV